MADGAGGSGGDDGMRAPHGRRRVRSVRGRVRRGDGGPHGNLPAPISSFIGREQEIAEVGRLLARHRLLTLTGAGGVGKSRLALEVARTQTTTSPDGVWLVELAALVDGRLVLQALASTLGVREQPGQGLLDTLLGFSRSRNLLLLLDNGEHLTEACAALVAMLMQRCPGMRIVATSRQPLGAADEVVWRVPSLALPDADGLRLREVVESESGRLFVERARAASRTFEPRESQAWALVEICRRLDGIPLAIELAAALVPALTVEQIARRLDDRFRLLTGGDRSGLPRHRTLRSLVDWSYGLLTARERSVLLRLAVFAGGWALDAADAVAGDELQGPAADQGTAVPPERYAAPEMRAVLARLASSSLVMVDRTRDNTRFSLLETIRAYALEKLRASGEEPAIRRRHLDWVVALVTRAEPLMWTSEQRVWLERLARELPNVRAALAWSLESGNIEAGLWIAGGLWRFWEQRGQVGEARGWLTALLAAPAGEPSAVRARALTVAGYFAYMQGDRPTAEALTAEGLERARALDDPLTFVIAIQVQGILTSANGDLDRTEAYIQEGLARSRGAGLDLGVRISLLNLGELARMRGDNRAEALLEESFALSEAAGDVYAQANTLTCLAHLAFLHDTPDTAARRYARALTLWHDLGDNHNLPDPVEGLGWTAAAGGQAERAARLLGAASAMREAVGTAVYPRWQADHEQAAETARAALGERAFTRAWERGRAMSSEQVIGYALDADARPNLLTDREREIAGLIADGTANREIARILGISERTVEWHVSNVLGKIDGRSRGAIAAWALEHGVTAFSEASTS